MRICLLLALTLTVYLSQAQNKQTIELLPGVTTLEALQTEVYLYPQFTEGIVAFKNGKSGKSKLNYFLLNKEMLFIDNRRDTLALTNEPEIEMLLIGLDTFYYNGQHFIKQVSNYGWIKTAQLKSIKEIGRKQTGAYGETVTGAAVSLSSMQVSRLFVGLSNSEKIILQKETKYYIGNEGNFFLPLTKNNVMKLIPRYKQEAANKYLKENTVDFNHIDQVTQMLAALGD